MINSRNEWDPLLEVVVGSAQGAFWPQDLLSVETAWDQSPMPQGEIDPNIIDVAERELNDLSEILSQLGVRVRRPTPRDFSQGGGMYNYCPRDRLLIVDDTVVITNMMMPVRNRESECLDSVISEAASVIEMPQHADMVLDAANVCRIDDTLLFLESKSGTRAAASWLTEIFPNKNIEVCNFYSGTHIDSTIVPLRPGLVLLNATRVTPENCPAVFDNWEKIWIYDVVARDFYQYPYASKWIGMNMLVVDPQCVIVDSLQTDIITDLEKRRFTVIPMTLTHSRTLGGGFHCVTLDLHRDHV